MTAKAFFVAACVLSLATLMGCGGDGEQATSSSGDNHEHGDGAHGEHGHHHTDVGVHGGAIIELGNEAYHAELLHDEKAGAVTVYMLDAAASGAVPIEATELTINVTHDGQARQFKLAAAPAEGDPEGRSSQFTSSDAELIDALHESDAQLVVTIEGKQYRGAIEAHDHEHAHE